MYTGKETKRQLMYYKIISQETTFSTIDNMAWCDLLSSVDSSESDLIQSQQAGHVIRFENAVYSITHEKMNRYKESLHNALRIPKDGIGMKICSWVKPEIELLLSVAFSLAEDISVKDVRITAKISQELKVYLIPCWSFRR